MSRLLVFKVDKQVLSKQPGCDFSRIVAGTKGYLKAKFYFSDSEWLNCDKKVACFRVGGETGEYPVALDKANECTIPEDALVGSTFEVKVEGVSSDFGYHVKTNWFKIKQEV